MADQLGLSRGPLGLRARQARRLLPRAVRRDLMVVAQAAEVSGNPRIARTLDVARVEAAFERAHSHLAGPAPREARKTQGLRFAAGLALRLLLGVGAVLALVAWLQGG